MHLRAAVCSLFGETILPSSTSLPDPSSQPQNDSAVEVSRFDRMESELKVLQQQAQATQQSLKQLQSRETVDPMTAIRSDLSAAMTFDANMLGVAGLLVLVLAMVWWYLWHRPRTTPLEAELTVMPDREVDPVAVAMPAPAPATSSAPPPSPAEQPADAMASRSFAQRDAGVGFDSEAAANEVTRVRKSLADKREARALTLEREDMPGLDEWQARQELPPLEFDLELETAPEDDGPISFSLPTHRPAPAPQPETDAFVASADAPPVPLATEHPCEPDGAGAPTPKSESEPDKSAEYDYSITLALAEESEALELWTEARELAREVLLSSDPTLQAQAQSLLDRLDPLEQASRLETGVWGETR